MTTIRNTTQVPPQYAIKQIPGYETHDGRQFHKLEEAQNHTKDSLIGGIFEALCRTEHRFSKLDAGLFRDAVKRIGVQIAQVIQDPMTPVGNFPHTTAPVSLHPMPGATAARAKAHTDDASRQTADAPLKVEDPLRAAMARIDAKEAEIAENAKKLAEIKDLAKAAAQIEEDLKFLSD